MPKEILAQPSGEKTESSRDYSSLVMSESYGAHSLYLSVSGIKCGSCAVAIEKTLNEEPEVSASVNSATGKLSMHWRGDAARGNELAAKVDALGYRCAPYEKTAVDAEDKKEELFLLRCMVISGAASVNIMLLMAAEWYFMGTDIEGLMRELVRWVVAPIALPAVIYSGRPFFFSAWNALKNKRSNMDVPISMALILTSAMSLFEVLTRGENSYFDSVVMLAFLLLIGRYLDRKTRGRARAAAQDLLAMMSGAATVVENGETKLLSIGELKKDMLLQVAAGEKIAADGVVESGSSEADTSFITGETATQHVSAGTKVFGGMINLLSPIYVRITATGGESLLGEVVKLMEKAEQGHAKFVRFADKIARIYTPAVLFLSALTFLLWWGVAASSWQNALLVSMTVLIITCPCAMGLAVPSVQVIAGGRLFRKGMLLKSSDALERISGVDTIVFDKTGTLTEGKPKLVNAGEISPREMQIAASLASGSRHPLARAVKSRYEGDLIDTQITEISGKGIEAKVDGKRARLGRRDWCGDVAAASDEKLELWLEVEGEKPVRFIFEDGLRSDARETIATLKKAGYFIELLSGDREQAVAAVAAALGIESYRSGVDPVEKGRAIEMLRQRGRRVLMVGDGLNDAPALAAADVSMSPSTALDIAQNAADIVFQGGLLSPVVEALSVGIFSDKLVRQNFAIAFIYNILAVPLAMLGLVTPLIAAVAMSASSILVVGNAQRLRRAGSGGLQ